MSVNPLKAKDEIGMDRLRAIMAYACLRRKKQEVMDTIQLVPKTGTIYIVNEAIDVVNADQHPLSC